MVAEAIANGTWVAPGELAFFSFFFGFGFGFGFLCCAFDLLCGVESGLTRPQTGRVGGRSRSRSWCGAVRGSLPDVRAGGFPCELEGCGRGVECSDGRSAPPHVRLTLRSHFDPRRPNPETVQCQDGRKRRWPRVRIREPVRTRGEGVCGPVAGADGATGRGRAAERILRACRFGVGVARRGRARVNVCVCVCARLAVVCPPLVRGFLSRRLCPGVRTCAVSAGTSCTRDVRADPGAAFEGCTALTADCAALRARASVPSCASSPSSVRLLPGALGWVPFASRRCSEGGLVVVVWRGLKRGVRVMLQSIHPSIPSFHPRFLFPFT
ncbi:hypothetical protein B0H16DRAFT_1586973 [Mycena metata]|uniref:Uncharacterized protein n=1 Tax=Mycena metata TaxID=1033252 RepID=A0AAD7HVI7_9AGAR|nr:hypothetical protein B0H16DRAFT_1586973 [Mycena metata]